VSKIAEQTPLRLPAGTIERIDKVRWATETRADFLRRAVENEILFRENEFTGSKWVQCMEKINGLAFNNQCAARRIEQLSIETEHLKLELERLK